MKRLGLIGIMGVVTAMAAMLVGAPSASASYGKLAQYQITFSQNCNNASYCLGGGDGLGGAWGWAVLNSDGTGDLEITFCGHLQGVGGGAGHEDVDFYAWHIDTENGVFFIDSASDPDFEGDTPIPSAPGRYNLHPAPGVNMEITVTKIPNR